MFSSHYDILISIISGTTCEEDDIRLVGGYSVKEGRVQVCYNGTWHSVCADRWSDKEASVVCSTLGYPSSAGLGKLLKFSYLFAMIFLSFSCGRFWWGCQFAPSERYSMQWK